MMTANRRARAGSPCDEVSGEALSEDRGGAGAGDAAQPEDSEVADRGREVPDVAADEAEGKAAVRVAPAPSFPEAEMSEVPRGGCAEAEPVMKAEPPAHPHAEHAVPARVGTRPS